MARFRTRMYLQALEQRTVPATFTVMNNMDSGAGSLRQAILDANAMSGTDSITFDPATFSGIVSINLTTGALAITDAVTIKGTGSDSLTVNAGGTSRVFDTSGAPSASAITISGMTMSGGK